MKIKIIELVVNFIKQDSGADMGPVAPQQVGQSFQMVFFWFAQKS